jgi:signal transduction histidine kinase
MDELHRLLKRQLVRSGQQAALEGQASDFLQNVNRTYHQMEEEKHLLEENTSRMLQKISSTNDHLQNIIETLDGFNYHVSHDLKTGAINLTSLARMIRKYVELEDYGKIKEIADKIDKTAKSNLTMIEKFLEISKFDSKQSGEAITEFEIEPILNDLLDELDLKNKLFFEIIHKDFSSLEGKKESITSLFRNLFTNAYKYRMPDRSPHIRLELIQDNVQKIITFEDNGIGIDLERDENKLFKPFVRLRNDLDQDGTGVGLFIVKKIVMDHGGSIKVDSHLNKGTKFTVILNNTNQ